MGTYKEPRTWKSDLGIGQSYSSLMRANFPFIKSRFGVPLLIMHSSDTVRVENQFASTSV